MLNRKSWQPHGCQDIHVLSYVLWLHKRLRSSEKTLRFRSAWIRRRQDVALFDLPALSRLEEHAFKPHGFLGEILDMDFEKDLLAFGSREEGGGRTRCVDFSFDR